MQDKLYVVPLSGINTMCVGLVQSQKCFHLKPFHYLSYGLDMENVVNDLKGTNKSMKQVPLPEEFISDVIKATGEDPTGHIAQFEVTDDWGNIRLATMPITEAGEMLINIYHYLKGKGE